MSKATNIIILSVFMFLFIFTSCNKPQGEKNVSSSSSVPDVSSSPVNSCNTSNFSSSDIPSKPSSQSKSPQPQFSFEPAKPPVKIEDVAIEFDRKLYNGNDIGSMYFYAGRLYLNPQKATFANMEKDYVPLQPPIKVENESFLCLFDFCKALKLYCDFNYNDKKIVFLKDIPLPFPKKEIKGQKQALIRFEDFSADFLDSDYLLKYRILSDFMASRGVPFSVAWIPKFVNPIKNIENDPSKNYSFFNIEFVYTLDYLLSQKAQIGLHGYTHQSANDVSGIGFEFGEKRKLTAKESTQKFENAIGVAKRLNIKYSFFEFPHYSATKEQYDLAEKHFDVLYNPPYNAPKIKSIKQIKRDDRTITYISTPLDFLKSDSDADIQQFIRTIEENKTDTLASMFFHSGFEISYIKILRENGQINITYDINSPLNRILNAFEKNNYKFIRISECQ